MKLSEVSQGSSQKLSDLNKESSSPSIWSRMGTGIGDPFLGMAQLAVRAPSLGAESVPMPLAEEQRISSPEQQQESIKAIDEAVRQRESSYQQSRGKNAGTDWARIVGNILSPPNIGLSLVPGGAATLPGRMAIGALTGGINAVLEPTASDDFWTSKAKQLAIGLGIGGSVPAAATALRKGIAPTLSADARALSEAGVSLTPGQMAGRWLRRPEEAAKSLPILGSFIRGSEGRGIDTFNTSVINQSLEPIGESLPRGMKAGREAVDFAAQRLSDSYEQILPQMRFAQDQAFADGIQNLRQLASEMPPGQASQFENILQNRLYQRLGPEGNMDGETLKQVESELGNFASEYRSSSDAAQRQLATAFDETRSLIRQAVERQNPEFSQRLRNINAGYAMLTRIENASSRRLGSQGVFTPMDLLASIRQGDRTVRHRDFAHGDALMQQFADTGQRVLSKELPDSGTTERALWDAVIRGLTGLGILGGASGSAMSGGVGLPATVALGTMVAPYTRAGGAAVEKYMTPSEMRETIGRIAEQLGRKAAPSAAIIGTSPSQR